MHAMMNFLIAHGYAVIFVAVLIEQLGLPVPSGPVLLAAGALIGLGSLDPAMVMLLSIAACLMRDNVWVWWGRRRGNKVLKFLCRVSLEPEICVAQTQSRYQRYGPNSLLVAKFIPGFGALATPMAGMFGLAVWRFLSLDCIASALWAGAYVITGYLFRAGLEDLAAELSRFGIWAGILIVSCLAAYILTKYHRRRKIFHSLRTERITPQELKERIDSGEQMLIVDLRAEHERVDGVIPGAVVMAYEEVDALVQTVGGREVIFYCSCPNEAASVRAALRLRRHGAVRTHPLLGGFDSWKNLGYPVIVPAAQQTETPP
jgi:membrane protein DedA with SNARE-associated domain/rhodanese-related sulfurtransferase